MRADGPGRPGRPQRAARKEARQIHAPPPLSGGQLGETDGHVHGPLACVRAPVAPSSFAKTGRQDAADWAPFLSRVEEK
jgi:hypothetical protein